MRKSLLLVMSVLSLSSALKAQQTTVTFRPGPSTGQDAYVWHNPDNCIIYDGDNYLPAPQSNWGYDTEFMFDYWTYYSVGCSVGTRKGFLRFDELSTLRPGIRIISATLKLKSPDAQRVRSSGNSTYPGSPYSYTNDGILKRILPGSNNRWDENSITWNNSINIQVDSRSNWVNIPSTNQRFDYNLNLNITDIVREIYNDLQNGVTNANNGFILELLDNNTIYQCQTFATSEYPIASYRPALEIVYESSEGNDEKPECNANFTISNTATNPLEYRFGAVANNANYTWLINNSIVGTSQNLTYLFSNNKEKSNVCLEVYYSEGNTCSECITLFENTNSINSLDVNKIKIYPNPTSTSWNIDLNGSEKLFEQYTLKTISGVMLDQQEIKNKTLSINSNFPTGIYILELKGNGQRQYFKLIKE